MIATVHELARSNEELNRFSYVCSHDMKEPVRMIESMAALLTNRDFDANEKVRAELLSRISVNTSRLRAIIDGLLAYSRIEAKVEMTQVDLNLILAEICDGLSMAAEDHGAKIEVGPLPVVNGATVHFTQLFHNLIGNALKYSDKEIPLIRLSARKSSDGWTFLLEDNGPGVPEEARLEIFKLFSRLKRRDEVEGTGLGLSIAQRIVEQYKGQIKCLSSVLGGAAFEIFIPHAS
jgi:light-regulated signal transduction histidine kinase (bacteriophytochrome)